MEAQPLGDAEVGKIYDQASVHSHPPKGKLAAEILDVYLQHIQDLRVDVLRG
jgi:hypothetical protein